MELSEYFKIFRARWLLIATITFLAVDAAVAVNWILPRTYTASAMVFITAESATSSSYENSQFTMQRVKSYPDLVHSPEVLEPVISNLGLDASMRELHDRLEASNPTETVYVKVTAEGSTADDSAALANAVAQSLTKRIKDLEAGEGVIGAAVEPVVAVPAVAPGSPSSPKSAVNLAIGGVAGLSLGMALALALGRFNRRIYTAEDVLQASQLDLLGQIGIPPTGKRNGKSDVKKKDEALSYRELWTHVLLSTGGQLPGILAMTPACSGAASASSILMRHGAEFLAGTGRQVCALESNSDIGSAFGEVESDVGFTNLIAGNATVAETSNIVGVTGALTVVKAGGLNHDLLDSEVSRRAGTVVKEMAQEFDLVLTTTGYEPRPVSTAMIAPIADGVLILAAFGKTTAAQLDTAVLELRSIGVRPLGVVLLNVPSRRRSKYTHLLGRQPQYEA